MLFHRKDISQLIEETLEEGYEPWESVAISKDRGISFCFDYKPRFSNVLLTDAEQLFREESYLTANEAVAAFLRILPPASLWLNDRKSHAFHELEDTLTKTIALSLDESDIRYSALLPDSYYERLARSVKEMFCGDADWYDTLTNTQIDYIRRMWWQDTPLRRGQSIDEHHLEGERNGVYEMIAAYRAGVPAEDILCEK